MTKHTDTSRSTDSGVSGNAQTGAREIRHLAERATDAGEWSAQIGAELAKRTIISGEGIVQGELIATNVYPRDAEYIVAVQPKNILKLLSECSRLASRVAELDARERHWNFCDKHKTNANGSGVRGGCPECSEAEMAQALYEIDAAVEPNKEIAEHGATLYNLSCDPQVVVKSVKRLASRVEELEKGLRVTTDALQNRVSLYQREIVAILKKSNKLLAGAHAEEKE